MDIKIVGRGRVAGGWRSDSQNNDTTRLKKVDTQTEASNFSLPTISIDTTPVQINIASTSTTSPSKYNEEDLTKLKIVVPVHEESADEEEEEVVESKVQSVFTSTTNNNKIDYGEDLSGLKIRVTF